MLSLKQLFLISLRSSYLYQGYPNIINTSPLSPNSRLFSVTPPLSIHLSFDLPHPLAIPTLVSCSPRASVSSISTKSALISLNILILSASSFLLNMASPLLTPSAISTSSSSSHRSATPRMGTLGGSLTPSPSIQSDEIDYFTCRAKAEGSGPAPTPVEEAEICYIRAVVSISPAVSKRFSLPARRKPSALDMSGPEPRPWSALHIPRRKALTPRELTDSHDRPHIDGLPLAPSSALPDPFSPRDVSTSFPSIDGLFPTSHLVPPTLSIDRPSTLLAASHGSNTSSDFTAPQAQRSPSPTLPVISPCQPLSIEHATATDELELRRSATGTLSKKSSSSYT